MSETQIADTPFENTDDLAAFATDFFGEKQAAPPAAKPEAEQEAVEEQAVEETEAQENPELTDEDEAEAEAELAKEPVKKSKVQERIDELVKQRHDAERKAEAREAALRKEFEEKLAALAPKPVETQKAAEPKPDDLKADGTAKYELGEFDPAFIRDLTKHTLEAERAQAAVAAEAQRKEQEQATATAALAASWNTKVAEAKERLPDLETKGQELLNGFANLDPGYAGYLSTVLMSMDHGPDVLHYLANNPEEARKIVNSGAQKATLALGRIEGKFLEAEAQKLVAKPKISKAPPPPAASARGTGGGVKTIEADTDDLDAFEKSFFSKRK